MGESALDATKTQFIVDVGATYIGPGGYDIDYLVVGEALSRGLVSSPFLNYEAAIRVRPDPDAEILATIREPYFSRTYAAYCSHRNTPHRPEKAAHPGALRKIIDEGLVCVGDLLVEIGGDNENSQGNFGCWG